MILGWFSYFSNILEKYKNHPSIIAVKKFFHENNFIKVIGSSPNYWINSSRKIIVLIRTEAFARRSSVKKVFIKILQNSQENTCTRVFSCGFCEISRITFSYRISPVAASVRRNSEVRNNISKKYIESFRNFFSIVYILFN